MGIWYTPPPSFIGGPQPYEPRRNVPPSEGDRPFPPKPWWPAWYAWQVPNPLPALQKKFTLPVGDQPPTISSPWWPIWWKGLPPDPLPTLQVRFPFVPGDQPPSISAPWWPDYWAWILKEVPRVIPPPVMTPPVEGVQPPEPSVVSPVTEPTLAGSKARKRIRGPYSDPRIYQAYIARCIAEREKPRINIEVALLKEALVDEVEKRRQTTYDEYDALIRENHILERLISFERTKRDLSAIASRQRQISVQIDEIMEQEAQSIIMLLNDM